MHVLDRLILADRGVRITNVAALGVRPVECPLEHPAVGLHAVKAGPSYSLTSRS